MRQFTYTGHYRYSLTICARRPGEGLRSAQVVAQLLLQLRQQATEHGFAVHAYCFMPDHVHLLVEGLSEDAEVRRFAVAWKQASGFWFRREIGGRLWMPGYYDHVLTHRQQTMDVVRYVLMNPVKAGLAKRLGEFPFAGSDLYTMEELLEVLGMGRPEGLP